MAYLDLEIGKTKMGPLTNAVGESNSSHLFFDLFRKFFVNWIAAYYAAIVNRQWAIQHFFFRIESRGHRKRKWHMIGVRPPLYDRALIAHRYNIISVFRDEHTPALVYLLPSPPNHSPIIYTLNHPITDIDKVSKGKQKEKKKTDILEKWGGSSHFKPDMRVRISGSFKHLLSLLSGILGKKKRGRGNCVYHAQ